MRSAMILVFAMLGGCAAISGEAYRGRATEPEIREHVNETFPDVGRRNVLGSRITKRVSVDNPLDLPITMLADCGMNGDKVVTVPPHRSGFILVESNLRDAYWPTCVQQELVVGHYDGQFGY